MDTETLTEQIRKIVAQGMAGRVASIHTARAIVRLLEAADTATETETGGK